jgi:hypothetical protein
MLYIGPSNKYIVMNQVGNANFPPSVHLIFFSTNIRNENNTCEIQKWPRARDRISLISLRCVFFFIQIKHYQVRSNRVCEPHRRVQINNTIIKTSCLFEIMIFVNAGINE